MATRKRASTRVKTVVTAQTAVSTKAAAASVPRRFGGFFLDYLILGIPNSIVLWFLKDNGLYSPIATYYNIFFALLVLFYFTFLTWKNNGQTIGKQIVGTRVVGWRGKLNGTKILIRYAVLFVLVQFPSIYHLLFGHELGIAFLLLNVLLVVLVAVLLVFDDEHRGVHDLLAGTWVVRSKNG